MKRGTVAEDDVRRRQPETRTAELGLRIDGMLSAPQRRTEELPADPQQPPMPPGTAR